MREILINLVASLTKQDASSFSDDTVIREIPGFDSLQFVLMLSELQEKYSIEIPLEKIMEINTLGDLITAARKI